MHSKKRSRWLKLISATLGLTALIGATVALPSQAVSPTPSPLCTDGTCWVTFDYTGDYALWSPPTGISSLHFDVYGAQGGRTGGKGGLVSGDFALVPQALIIYVGGAGGVGNGTAGGFNGGGNAGTGHADQGSGGGATDIRISGNLADRVVVAGGGGGTGGWIGGAGGAGGMALAAAGSKGSPSGSGGGGGTQGTGGAGGAGVTTGNGTNGLSGQGGSGGTGTVAGGGGGGGGFFGGGGGGSDSVAGGSDGAGGGGGSSFATMALTTNVSHSAGVRSGNGLVTFRYTYPPKLNSITLTSGSISTTGDATFQLSFDQYVWEVDPWDFSFNGTAGGCSVSSVSGDGYLFNVQVTGCQSGTLKLGLHPNSVLGASAGPLLETLASSTVTIDTTPANLKLTAPTSPTHLDVINFVLTSDKPISNPTAADFDLVGSGCSIGTISMITSTTAQIGVQNCASGANILLTVKKNQIHDLSGNASPAADLPSSDVLTDYEPPSVSSVITSTVTADTLDYAVTFSEPVTSVSASAFLLSGTGCNLSKFDGTGAVYHVYVTGCSGDSSLTVKSLTARDAAGNLGPVQDQVNSGNSLDTLAPSATFTELERLDKSTNPSFELRFDELVSGLTANSLSRSGTAKNCNFNLVEVSQNRVYRVDTTNCSPGTIKLKLQPGSVVDSHGNAGPNSAIDSPTVRISAGSSGIRAAALTALPEVSSELAAPTESQNIYGTRKVAIKQSQNQLSSFSPDAITPDSWVSLLIALIALVIAGRPRGRRRAEATRR